jgi:hypothetical protein
MAIQNYNTAPPRIGILGAALGQPVPKPKRNPRTIEVKAHTRLKPKKRR